MATHRGKRRGQKLKEIEEKLQEEADFKDRVQKNSDDFLRDNHERITVLREQGRQYTGGKHAAKYDLKTKEGKKFGQQTKEIFSDHSEKSIRNTLNQVGKFIIDCEISASLSTIKNWEEKFLYWRLNDQKVSNGTAKTDRANLQKITGNKIDFEIGSKGAATKGRNTDDRFSQVKTGEFNPNSKRNQDIKSFIEGTGLRRTELANATKESFKEINGSLYVTTVGKGGRERTAAVIGNVDRIRELINQSEPGKPVIGNVSTRVPTHYFRREYARNMYDTVTNDAKTFDRIKHDLNLQLNAAKGYESDDYHSRLTQETYSRESLAITSEMLGHSRLEVVVKSYLGEE